MKKLSALLTELEKSIPDSEKLNISVSASSVGWHIEHTLLTTSRIIETVKKSNPKEYRTSFNIKRLFVFATNKIPRGKGQAPEAVRPQSIAAPDELKKKMEKVKAKVEELGTLHPNSYFEHPYFDKLNLKAAIRFLHIHTKHHINIINDIIKSG
jgi:DinB superfamily